MKRVLVTGGAGFIGSHTIDRLLQHGGWQVSVIDSFNDYYNPAIKRANLEAVRSSLTVHEGDLSDEAFVKSVFSGGSYDAVIHLAARAGVRPSIALAALHQTSMSNQVMPVAGSSLACE